MKKTMRKLIPAVLMLLISAMLVGTSTYAWFAMNSKVTVTGMTVKTKVSDSIQIAPDTLGSTARVNDNTFVNDYVTSTIKGYLEPASTVNATTYYYTSTSNVAGSGDAITDAYIPYEDYLSTNPEDYGTKTATDSITYSNRFSENYGVSKTDVNGLTGSEGPAVAFIDYVFQLKVSNVNVSNEDLNLTQLDLIYNGTDNRSNAFRVAFLIKDITSSTTGMDDPTTFTNAGIYKESAAANFDATPKAVDSTSTLGTVSYIAAGTALTSVTPGTHYYKVIARLWLEGEDTTCNTSTFMALSQNWELQLAIELNQGSKVAAITELLALTASSKTVTAEGKQTISATDYNVVTGLTYNGDQVYTTATAGTLPADAHLFTIANSTATEVTSNFKIS